MCGDRGFDQRSDQTKDYAIYIGTWRKRIKAKTSWLVVSIIPSLHGIEIMKFSMNISYIASVQLTFSMKICYLTSVLYDTGFKVLSMKIKYFAPFKHKHKHQKFTHEN
jgi:hypothetical protein